MVGSYKFGQSWRVCFRPFGTCWWLSSRISRFFYEAHPWGFPDTLGAEVGLKWLDLVLNMDKKSQKLVYHLGIQHPRDISVGSCGFQPGRH